MIAFTIPGTPQPKGRPRARVIHKRGRKPIAQIYTPEETRTEEARIRTLLAVQRRAGPPPRAPLAGPLRMDVVFVLPRPQKLPAGRSPVWPHVGADVDNFLKLLADAGNEILYDDDSQICQVTATKIYGSPTRTEVRISQLTDADESQCELWGGLT